MRILGKYLFNEPILLIINPQHKKHNKRISGLYLLKRFLYEVKKEVSGVFIYWYLFSAFIISKKRKKHGILTQKNAIFLPKILNFQQ